MAVNLYPPLKIRIEPLLSEPARYRRRDTEVKTKKIQRKFRVKMRHAGFSLILIAGLFAGAQQGWLFLMGWDRLNIDRIEIRCRKQGLREAAGGWLERNVAGNLLLLNIKHLRGALEAHPWISSVRVRKHFPSTLRIEISERVPAALLEMEPWMLIDREGVELAPAAQRTGWDLPRIMDSNRFQEYRQEKLALAWRFLDALPPEDRARVAVVDVGSLIGIKVKRTDFPAWLYFGRDRFAEKMENFRTERAYLQGGPPLEYVDLSLVDRVVLKPQAGMTFQEPAPERR
jgi:cell division septal protein FtsQ